MAAFARLRQYGPDTLRAFASIRACPRRALRIRRDSVPLIMPAGLIGKRGALVRSPAIAFFVGAQTNSPHSRRIAGWMFPRVEETVDSAANRTILALVLALLRRTRALGEMPARSGRQREIERDANVACRTLAEAQAIPDSLASHLKILLRLSPVRDVQRAEITAAGLTAIAAESDLLAGWSSGVARLFRHGIESGTTLEALVSPFVGNLREWCASCVSGGCSPPEWRRWGGIGCRIGGCCA